jgi:hypothetical protein
MRVAARHVVLLADLENAIDGFGDDGMLVISRVTQLLTEVAFADQDDADTGNFFQNSRQVVDGARFFALNDDKDFSLWY